MAELETRHCFRRIGDGSQFNDGTEGTWYDGTGAERPFNSHLKPSEAIHPDRCVRVYFDYDEKRAKTIVAWVGKHPGGLMKTIHRLTKGLVLDRETDRNVRMK